MAPTAPATSTTGSSVAATPADAFTSVASSAAAPAIAVVGQARHSAVGPPGATVVPPRVDATGLDVDHAHGTCTGFVTA